METWKHWKFIVANIRNGLTAKTSTSALPLPFGPPATAVWAPPELASTCPAMSRKDKLTERVFQTKKLKLCEKKIHKEQRCIPSITESQASRRSCKHSCKHEWISAILRKHAPNIHRSLYKVDGTFGNVDIWWHYHHGLSDSALVKFFHWIQQTERVAPNNWPNMANIAGKKKAWLCLCIDGVSRLTSTLSRMGCVILATVWVVTRLSKEQTKSKNVHL